jgi:hypothetical protein
MGERWTEEAVLQESERWVHVPQDGRCIEDERRLLVHLPKPWGMTRVWRSRVADEERASDLIEETVDEVRATGGGRILWHTGDRIAPPFMDECLARHGFRTTEKLEVLAFVLINGQGQRLPRIGVPKDLSVELVRNADLLREAFRVDSALRLWGAATRQSYRGRGAYKALIMERCRVGRHLGATLALAKANVATSTSILERAGFCRFGTERRHVLEIHR